MMVSMSTWCLSLHADYRCHHAGVCCESWTVPAEPQVVQLVEARRIRRADVKGPLFVESTTPPEAPGWEVARDADGGCVFFDRGGSRLCAIHHDAGANALPSACRHFPRKILRDRRGTFISLSHFCPTAAVMLLAPVTLRIVEAHPPLRLSEPVEGLDAADALPPLLRPGVLSDLEGYDAWERECVATFARSDLSWQDALDLVAAATEQVREWRPGGRTLSKGVHEAFRDARPEAGADAHAHARAMDTVSALSADHVAGDIHHRPADPRFEEIWLERVGPGFGRFDAAMKNYLASRVFANWIAYQGRGLRGIVEWLRICAALVRHHFFARVAGVSPGSTATPADGDFVEAVRAADLFLLHVADTQAFAWRFAGREGPDPR
jgi:Fe-S-cluster containining protein